MLRTPLAATILVLMTSSASAPTQGYASEPRLAAPEIIIFHGGPLSQSIVVASWTENELLLRDVPHEPAPPVRTPLGRRPVIKLALFWGSQWRVYAESPPRLAMLSLAQANQLGEYLPAVPGLRAIIRVGSIDGPVSDSGLAVLRRHAIPTRWP